MINLFLFIYLIFQVYSNIIRLKFENLPLTYNDNIQSNFGTIYSSNLITSLKVGTPPKKINTFIIFAAYEYFIIDNKTNSNFYSRESSKTFYKFTQTPVEYYDTYFRYGYYSTETFYLNNISNEEIKLEKLHTMIAINSSLKYPSYLGLNFYDELQENKVNFVEALGSKKNITHKVFSIEFFNENEGEIIIGNFPHVYNSKEYDEKDLKWNNVLIDSNYMYWNLYFYKIFIDNEEFKGSTACYLEYEYNCIYAPIEYKNKLEETFFKNNKNKCKEYVNSTRYRNNKTFYVCDKGVNYKNFPKIKFKSNEFNFEFVLDFKDLFKEINGKLYLLVVFEQSRNFYRWRLGIPFLKNYLFIFDQDKAAIGFYGEKKNIKTFPKYLIFLFFFIIILLLFIIYQLRDIKRKRRVNEVEEEYNYITQEINQSL